MALLRNLLSRRLHSILNPHNRPFSPYNIPHPNTSHSLKIPSFHHRPITSSTQFEDPIGFEHETKQNKRPLYALFVEAVGLSEKTGTSESEDEGETEHKDLNNKLRQLEGEVRNLKEKSEEVPKKEELKKTEKRSLYSMFTNQPASVSAPKEEKLREPRVLKELSPDMEIFVEHLYKNGYFRNVNFPKDRRFDFSWFESDFGRGYIKFAAQKFATDNQKIAKWLSGSALKQVAAFGCPSAARGHVIPAKRLRRFFDIPEDTVCSKCVLQESCKFVNQCVWKHQNNNLALTVVMKILISYALEAVDPQLVVPDQVKNSVSQLLKEALKLSQTA